MKERKERILLQKLAILAAKTAFSTAVMFGTQRGIIAILNKVKENQKKNKKEEEKETKKESE